jgi:hypothetical protein
MIKTTMPLDPERRERLRQLGARAGVVVSAFAVFSAGYAAMRSSDWRVMAGFTLLAGLCGVAAQYFQKRAGKR